MLIELKNISYFTNNKKILEDISFNINEKEIITIIGPNGSGKSTLIKIICGIIKNTSGSISSIPNIKFGYLPQRFKAEDMLPLNVLDFLKIYIENSSHNLDKIISILEIENLLNLRLVSLSGGELQKVLLARSLVTNPHILLLDEPMQGVDIASQIKFYNLLDIIRREFNLSIVLISHDLHFVMKKTDQVICINKHICCMGKPGEVSENKKFIDLFVGNNISQDILGLYTHLHDHEH